MNFTKTNLDMSLTREEIKSNFSQLTKESFNSDAEKSFFGVFFYEEVNSMKYFYVTKKGEQNCKLERHIGSSILFLKDKFLKVNLYGIFKEILNFSSLGVNLISPSFRINSLENKKTKCVLM